ncbi:hypothetical protein ACFW04_011074 [Cataglyphis niger]
MTVCWVLIAVAGERLVQGDKEKGSIIIEKTQSRRDKEKGCVIIEKIHELILNKRKLNIEWRKCPVFNHIIIKRCFKCWSYYHIAKNCTQNETCHKYAGNHKVIECTSTMKKCVNYMFKIQTYNLNISDEHDALDLECPTLRERYNTRRGEPAGRILSNNYRRKRSWYSIRYEDNELYTETELAAAVENLYCK